MKKTHYRYGIAGYNYLVTTQRRDSRKIERRKEDTELSKRGWQA